MMMSHHHARPGHVHYNNRLPCVSGGHMRWLHVCVCVCVRACVCVCVYHCPHTQAHFAIAGLRGEVVNVNTSLAAPEMLHILSDSLTRVIIADVEFAPTIHTALRLAREQGVPLSLTHALWLDMAGGDEGLDKQATPLPSLPGVDCSWYREGVWFLLHASIWRIHGMYVASACSATTYGLVSCDGVLRPMHEPMCAGLFASMHVPMCALILCLCVHRCEHRRICG